MRAFSFFYGDFDIEKNAIQELAEIWFNKGIDPYYLNANTGSVLKNAGKTLFGLQHYTGISQLNHSSARNRLLELFDIFAVPQEETVILFDADMYPNKLDNADLIEKLPFGVIKVFGKEKNTRLENGITFEEKGSVVYRLKPGSVDCSKPLLPVYMASRETLDYVGKFDERLVTSPDFIGTEDTDWIIKARLKGCEFVKGESEFYHRDHGGWLTEQDAIDNQLRRVNNSWALLEFKYGIGFQEFSLAQRLAKEFKDATGRS